MCDLETGESSFDIETGERQPVTVSNCRLQPIPILPTTHIYPKCTSFRIPIVSNSKDDMSIPKRLPFSGDISPIVLFLLPTLFVYPALTLILAIIEISIHMWAHQKNKTLNNPKYYYKSPLHSCVSLYCARCKEDNYMSTIGKLQDKRTMKYDCFKHLVS